MNLANRTLAQATVVPNNGASNAEDFQPPTGNPQQRTRSLQQQTGNLQDPTGYDILNNQSARIVIPTGTPASAPNVPEAAGRSVAPFILFSVLIVIAFAIAYFWNSRLKNARPKPEVVSAGPEPIAQSLEPVQVEKAEKVAEKPTAGKKQAPPKSKKKKSKSKRKKSRK